LDAELKSSILVMASNPPIPLMLLAAE